MRTSNDIVNALHEVCTRITGTSQMAMRAGAGNVIKDSNGNTVGKWSFHEST
ncbi:MAG: hypothetical protein IPM54_41260 [Polyangiaceae bacterium]|nr:hypothetical protein [Polyangiaceae bacterium]